MTKQHVRLVPASFGAVVLALVAATAGSYVMPTIVAAGRAGAARAGA